jgi:hypothetical protein
MVTMTKQSKTSLENSLTCKWCEKSFRSERTLSAHMCPRKRRWADKEMTHVRLGYRVFQMFYELNTSVSKPKSMEDFIRSQYYEGFTKFGRSCIRNEYLEPEKFAEWLIKNAKKLADWTKDKLYDEFLLQYVKKETGLRALERNVLYLTEWAVDNNTEWTEYFKVVSTPRAVHDVRSAKISPWMLYLSETGDQLLTRFSDEQVKMIQDIIDANFWMKVFAKNPEQVQAVKDTCEVAGI